MLVMACDQAVIRNSGGQVVDVVIRDIHGEPVEPARQDQKTGALDGGNVGIPALVVARIRVLEIVLYGKKQYAGAAGQRYADGIADQKQKWPDHPRHQSPQGNHHDAVPEHMPVLPV